MSKEIWPFLFFLGLLFFNWPFLEIFSVSLPKYLFGVWALFIIAIALIITYVSRQDAG